MNLLITFCESITHHKEMFFNKTSIRAELCPKSWSSSLNFMVFFFFYNCCHHYHQFFLVDLCTTWPPFSISTDSLLLFLFFLFFRLFLIRICPLLAWHQFRYHTHFPFFNFDIIMCLFRNYCVNLSIDNFQILNLYFNQLDYCHIFRGKNNRSNIIIYQF